MLLECNDNASKKYAPIPVGNGDFSLMIDYSGSNCYTDQRFSFHRAGIRQEGINKKLFPFGRFEQSFAGDSEPVTSWRQSLDTDNGLIRGCISYKSGASICSEVFCHLQKNVIVFRKTINAADGKYIFRFEAGDAKRMYYTETEDGLEYFFDGREEYRGRLYFLSMQPCRRSFDGKVYEMEFESQNVDIFFTCESDISLDYDKTLAETTSLWKEYWDESYIDIPDAELMKTYMVSQYHLRINLTRWMMPVGIFNTHWGSRYFAFDELFMTHAFASSGHLSLLRKIIDFHHECLPWARYRANGYYKNARLDARYPWERLEDSEEGSLCGHWQDHLFHLAHISLTCYYYWLYSGDESYLREKIYPVLEGCAEYYRNQAVVHCPNGELIITKCTDLERLGPGVENAYMTSCGAIMTLELAAHVGELLKLDNSLIALWKDTAGGLRKTLPQRDGMYAPAPRTEQRSIGVLSGLYPYHWTIPISDEKQKNAIYDFFSNDKKFGAMYPDDRFASSLCMWYAGWEAIALARYGDADNAYKVLKRAVQTETGSIGQVFELYASAEIPWFATGEGVFIEAVNELLLQVTEEENKIAPAIPGSWTDYSFRLQGKNGGVVEYKVKNNEVVCNKESSLV
jgi:trehalose/maltose hydrolase-like predicted phosphorylase